MKLFGKKIDKPSAEFCVIPRDGQDHVFKAEAILDFSEFEKQCKEPKESTSLDVKSGQVSKVKGRSYDKDLEEYSKKRVEYIICKSLLATEGLEWEKIDFQKPETWELYNKELKDSGLNSAEANKVVAIALSANSLDDTKYREARERFLASQSKKA